MRRAALLAAALAASAAGCERDGKPAGPPPTGERFETAPVAQKKAVSVDEFCDVKPASPATAPAATLPPLAPGSSAPKSGSWRWLNVWATWCKPCIEEMPRLSRWQKQLAGQGTKFDLVFLSVDDSDELVQKFRKQHPDTPPSLRIGDPDGLGKWQASLGLGEGAPIPIHVFIDPADKVRCVRAGGVSEADLAAVRSVLGSS